MKKINGFSLMEMMVVLLIISIIAAASAPIINKRLITAAADKSPWIWTGVGNNIAYNVKGGSQTAAIGATQIPDISARLYIDSRKTNAGAFRPHIAFGNDNAAGTSYKLITANDSIWFSTKTANLANALNSVVIGANTSASAANTVAIGSEANATSADSTALGYDAYTSGAGSTAIGSVSTAENTNSTAIGFGATASGTSSTAIGFGATASGTSSTAIGFGSTAEDETSTAVGSSSTASATASTAIGIGATASNNGSTAIGKSAKTTGDQQIVIGTASDTVYIPGNLIVGKSSYLGADSSSAVSALRVSGKMKEITGGNTNFEYRMHDENWITYEDDYIRYRKYDENWITAEAKDGSWTYRKYDADWITFSGEIGSTGPMTLDGEGNLGIVLGGLGAKDVSPIPSNGIISDRRLKNVGEVFKAGLEEIKKLEVFNFTFKDDENKTPRVGVMAQDLQKIFPDAVFKGEDGFLRIRLEDMFYALVNAVKELDTKIDSKIEELKNNEIAVLKDEVTLLKKENKELEKRLEALEKKLK